jgi:hypothetical protein
VRQLRGWSAAVAISTAVVVVVLLAIGIGWAATRQTVVTTYSVSAAVKQVDLQLASGQATIVGSTAPQLEVRRTDDYSFGHPAHERRWFAAGVLHVSSGCPRVVLGTCSASYELAVPEAVTIQVQTRGGDVHITGFNGNAAVRTGAGDIDVEAYCGFHLSARSGSGNVHVATACAPQSLSVRTVSGDALALVPPGHYRIIATSGVGRRTVTGVVNDPAAPFTLEVASATGSVGVEGGL